MQQGVWQTTDEKAMEDQPGSPSRESVHSKEMSNSSRKLKLERSNNASVDNDDDGKQRVEENNEELARHARAKPKLSFSVDSIMSSKSPSKRDSLAQHSASVYPEHTTTSAAHREKNNTDIESDTENVDIENVDSDSEDERGLDKRSPSGLSMDSHRMEKDSSLDPSHPYLGLDVERAKAEAAGGRGAYSVDGLLASPGGSRGLREELPRPPLPSFLGAVNPVDMARWSQIAFPSMGLPSPGFLNHSKWIFLHTGGTYHLFSEL